MDADRFVFAGGGTGGHLYPGLAVARALTESCPDARIDFFTTTRALDAQLIEPTPFERVPQSVRPFSSRPWHWPAFWLAWRASVRAARESFRRVRPRAVLGLGGYAAGPAVVAAQGLGVRTAILNPDAIPGRANRHLARDADLVVLQWEVSRAHFGANTNFLTCGCPIRAEFSQRLDMAECRGRFGLAVDRAVLLVTGASQGAQTVNEAVVRVWPEFVRRHAEWQLLHLTGAAHEMAIRSAYEAAGVGATVVGFEHEMWLALGAADVVISRAGASTLAELTALGKPSILLPYPYHRDRHQHANAQVLVDAGAAILIEDRLTAEANAEPLRQALERLADGAARAAMASAALRLGRARAARDVAEWLIDPHGCRGRGR